MPQVQLLRIVAASPADVQAERDALAIVVDELNQRHVPGTQPAA